MFEGMNERQQERGLANFAAYDGNGDGAITEKEYIDRVLYNFDASDTNKNKRLDQGERPNGKLIYKPTVRVDRAAEFRACAGADRIMNEAEFAGRRLYSSETGVDQLEREIAFHKLPDAQGGGMALARNGASRIRKFDRDGDMLLSEWEFRASRMDVFVRLDKNKNGLIDDDEYDRGGMQ